jgi:translation initiation factor IF-2
MKILNETLDYGDFKGEMEPTLSVDEYSAKMGKDKDIVTLAFTVNSKLCGEDLTSWLETGYDYILDAAVSDGEVDKGQWLVFAEMNRRTSVPERIIEVLEDLEGLTGFKLDDWKIKVNDKIYKADKDALSNVIELSPKEYARLKRKEEKEEKAEEELNQMRDIANLERPVEPELEQPAPMDNELKEFVSRAGL